MGVTIGRSNMEDRQSIWYCICPVVEETSKSRPRASVKDQVRNQCMLRVCIGKAAMGQGARCLEEKLQISSSVLPCSLVERAGFKGGARSPHMETLWLGLRCALKGEGRGGLT